MRERFAAIRRRFVTVLVGALACAGCGGENPMGPNQAGLPAAPPPAPAAPAPAKPPAGTAAPNTPVLYDARDRAKVPAGVEREPKLAPEVEKLVLSALSPGYKARREDCAGPEDVLFHVAASASGAFTAPGLKQAAYLVTSGPCDPAGSDAVEATHLVIVEGDKLLTQASGKTKVGPGESLAFYGTEIRAITDVDQDGTSELLVTSGAATDPPEEVARLYTVAGGAIKRVRAFTGVYRDGCASGGAGKAQAQVIHYVPGAKEGTSQYAAELYEAACPASGPPKPSDFQASKPVAVPPAAAPATLPGAAATTPPAAATPAPSPSASPGS